MWVIPEVDVEAEHEVQRLDGVVIGGDVQHGAEHLGVLGQGQVQVGRGKRRGGQQRLELLWPDLHQAVDVRHVPLIVHLIGKKESKHMLDMMGYNVTPH